MSWVLHVGTLALASQPWAKLKGGSGLSFKPWLPWYWSTTLSEMIESILCSIIYRLLQQFPTDPNYNICDVFYIGYPG